MIRKVNVILPGRSKTERVTHWAYFQDFPKEGAQGSRAGQKTNEKLRAFGELQLTKKL